MSSEDPKPVKNELEEEDEDDMCLSSIIRDKSKKKPPPSNAAPSKLSKPKEDTNGANGNSSQKKPVSKPVKVKKQEPASDSDDDKPICRKPVTKDDKSKVKSKKVEVKKKQEPASDSDDDKPIFRKTVTKDDKSKVKSKKVEVKKTDGKEAKKSVRKVYDLPGQKRDPPEERDPLRIFYESLYEQRNDSEMAAIWMMESGLLPEDVAKKVYEKKQKKNQMQRFGSPTKVVSKSVTVKKVKDPSSNSAKKTSTTKTVTTVKTKKRKKDESSEDEDSEGEDSEDDFVISKVAKKRKV